MELLEKNIDILTQNPIHWIGEYKRGNQQSLLEMDLNQNQKNTSSKSLLLFDKKQRPNALKKELIFAIGINSLQEIKVLFQTMSKESVIIIIEPSRTFFDSVLNNKDLSILKSQNIILFADDLTNLPLFLDHIFSTNLIYLVKNIRFYLTHYYREFNVKVSTEIVKEVKSTVKYKALTYGNSIQDSLTGFKQNMKNIKHLIVSKNVAKLQDIFKNVPAIIVAAGPSLNKNIKQIKNMKSRVIIIAVDTIAEKLIDEGIIPDFVCSIEREKETYDYFYKNKRFPKEVNLVGPLLLYPPIFDEFKGNKIIPMRENVGEYIWLRETLGLFGQNSVSLGLSCAHVAFGFAEHIGASPIILVGQDLAFDSSNGNSHAGGTIYDNKVFANNVFSNVNEINVEGYDGGTVPSTDIWVSFKKWFEKEIVDKELFVINATEGGAKIENTLQMKLIEVIEKYCSEPVVVSDKIDSVENYPISLKTMKTVLNDQRNILDQLKREFDNQYLKINRLKINKKSTEKELMKNLSVLQETDNYFQQVNNNWLLRHNLQPVLLTSLWDLNSIEQVLSVENLKKNKEIQLGFLEASIFVLKELYSIIENSLIEMKVNNGVEKE
ncbi:6-hydroxymethylpterin diphosphokinase MptE-like protein [Metabacillus sp. FJAT-52054]|uniref:6-hydroxymethylpterin diphosphokinase MptE-like protein n=1 Tax=Metabacillus sediminis TaxID=3117746 RepID=A0ABZ2NFN5_9BACI